MLRTGLFHPGRQHSWQVAAALSTAGCLGWHATAIYNDPARFPYSMARAVPGEIGRRLRAALARRSSTLVDPGKIRHLPAFEWAELAAARLGLSALSSSLNATGNRKFQRHVFRLLRREPVGRVWGYDTSCDWIFSRLGRGGIVRILDQSAGHAGVVRDILLRQRELYPELLESSRHIPNRHAIAQAEREIANADHIVVGADHGVKAAAAAGVARDRIHLVPYGYDEARFPAMPLDRPDLGSLPVRFLFVGTVGPRKGIHLLLQAFRRIPPQLARLRLVGPPAMPLRMLGGADNIEYVPALPHTRIVEEFSRAHCFVFPTLIDGGGVVLYEAAACGLGIVQSSMCGDGVRSGPLGSNGIVLQETTAEALQAAIEEIIARPAILRDWSAASWAMRQERTWSVYRQRIVELLPRLV